MANQRFIFVFCYILIGWALHGQGPINKVYQDGDTLRGAQTTMTDYLLEGDTYYCLSNKGRTSMPYVWVGHLSKVDYQGNLCCSYPLGDTSSTTEFLDGDNMHFTNSGSIVTIGYNSRLKNSSLIEIDTFTGAVTNRVNYNTSESNGNLRIVGIQPLAGLSGYLLLGNEMSSMSNVIIKVNSNGGEIWRRNISMGWYMNQLAKVHDEYLAVGSWGSGSITSPSNIYRSYITKIDSNALVIHSFTTPHSRKTYLENVAVDNQQILWYGNEYFRRGTNGADGHALYFLMDTALNIHLEKRLVKDTEGVKGMLGMQGRIDFFYRVWEDPTPGASRIAKIKRTIYTSNGDSLYSYYYQKPDFINSPGIEYYLHSIKNIGGVTHFCGTVIDGYPLTTTPGAWGWLVRTDSFGCVVPGCAVGVDEIPPQPMDVGYLSIYPNPIQDRLSIALPSSELRRPAHYAIYDILGNVISAGILSDGLQLEVFGFATGLYIVEVFDDGMRRLGVGKFIKN